MSLQCFGSFGKSFVLTFLLSSWLSAEIPLHSRLSLSSIFCAQIDAYRVMGKSLFQRLGELRDQPLNNGLWINEGFGILDAQEMAEAKLLYNDLSFGVDTQVDVGNGELYLGLASDVVSGKLSSPLYAGFEGDYALGVYLSYMHSKRFFIDLGLVYYHQVQNLVFQNSHLADSTYGRGKDNVAFSLNLGQRFDTSFSPMLSNFFFLEPSLTLETGYLPERRFTLRDGVQGRMKGFAPWGIKANLAFGREWNQVFKGAIKAGLSLQYDGRINGEIVIKDGVNPSYILHEREDFRVGFFLQGDFILSPSLRFFANSMSTFSGKLNTAYTLNLGLRYSFGVLSEHRLHSKGTIDWKSEKLQ